MKLDIVWQCDMRDVNETPATNTRMSGLLFSVSDRNGYCLRNNTPQNVTTDQSESSIPESRVIKADNCTILAG